jgi:cyclopropane-fatty-acyl-phospholipid synthase
MDAVTPARERAYPVVRATASTLALTPGLPASLRAAGAICLNLRGGGLTIDLPDGRSIAFGDADVPLQARIVARDWGFAKRALTDGDIGFAEGYMAGEWETPDLSALLTLFSANIERTAKLLKGNVFARLAHLVRHWSRENTKAGSKKNIVAHYDLGNSFYERWLDPTMTYSSALFDPPGLSLEAAQIEKYRAIARTLDLKPGERVLEIGCGWGGFAEIAAKEFGAHVTGLTLSNEQHDYAVARLARQGLGDRADIRLQDYRDVTGPFDKVASIEMFEAVGERYWPAYFSKVADVLRPGGRAALQIITIADELFEDYRTRADFIQRYIFPGGMLPSVVRLREETSRAGLAWDGARSFGLDYASTVAEWGRRFRTAWSEIKDLPGFDERFKRMWQFYLSYCEAGFRTQRTDVIQLGLVKG